MKNIIFIAAGVIVKDEKTGKWRTTNFNERDNFGVMGDRLRVEAAYELFKDNSGYIIVCVTGKGQLKDIPDVLPIKEVIKNELGELGIPDESIFTPGDAGSTYQELKELGKILSSEPVEKIIFVSNRWHILRVKAMAEAKFSGFNGVKTEFVSAEDYLIKKDPGKWKKIIDEAYGSEEMKKRLQIEEEGIKQIKEGNYNYR